MNHLIILLLIIGCAGTQKPVDTEYNSYSFPANYSSSLEPYSSLEKTDNKTSEISNTSTVVKCFGKHTEEQCVTITHEYKETFWNNK